MTAATQRAAATLLALNALFLDTETTGLDSQAEICDIAILDAAGTVLLDTLVKPARPIPAEATAIHGISNADVAAAPTMGKLWPSIAALLQNRAIVAYNSEFDLRILIQSVKAAGLPYRPAGRWFCAMITYAEHYGDWNPRRAEYRWQSLTNALTQQHIPPPADLHRARADAEACRLLVIAMSEEKEETPDGPFEEVEL